MNVGGRAFEWVRELGKGSFGVVWEVQDSAAASEVGEVENIPMALKCSNPANQEMLSACLFEIEVLQKLTVELRTDVAHRVPRYIAHSVSVASPSTMVTDHVVPPVAPVETKVFLAMSKLNGKPLDQWLYGINEHVFKTILIAHIFDGTLRDGQLATRDLADACTITIAIFSQMAPVFSSLASIAYHRDISAHNFLVHSTDGGKLEFALLDFGLAVSASSWQSECKTRNIAGDPRYFTPAAWMLMVYGHRYLEEHPDHSFLEQYRHRIDHYSFGLLLLELFFSLWQGPEVETTNKAVSGQMNALKNAHAAWRVFWIDSIKFFQMFHMQGFARTREILARTQAVSTYVDKLRALCSCLHAVAVRTEETAVSAVMKIAVSLIDTQASLRWEDLLALLPPVRQEVEQSMGTQHLEYASDTKAGAADIASGYTGQTTLECPALKRYSHRRYWSVDEAVSLARGIPEVAIGWETQSANYRGNPSARSEH